MKLLRELQLIKVWLVNIKNKRFSFKIYIVGTQNNVSF